jgi:hypothetical protein
MAVAEDAFKLLGRVAVHQSRSSQESQVQHARYPRREPSSFNVSYIYNDDELADASTNGNHSCASSEMIKSLDRIMPMRSVPAMIRFPYLTQHRYAFDQLQ